MVAHGLEWTRTIHGDDNAVVYHLTGVLGETSDSYAFLEDVRTHMGEQLAHLIICLGRVEMISSAGIGIIASCLTEAKRDGRTLALCEANRIVHRALDLTGFINMIPHFESEAEALAAPR